MRKFPWTVADLFSGAGGMSMGFHSHADFEVIGAVDAQVGKPSSKRGSLACNQTYEANMGFAPHEADLRNVEGSHLESLFDPRLGGRGLDVLLACPPCTGFSRANPQNHLNDDHRNNLVRRVPLWVKALRPKVVIMENARELISGNFAHHYEFLTNELVELGYRVHGTVHMLTEFGLPQKRERALVIAVKEELPLYTLGGLWRGFEVRPESVSVRAAISCFPMVACGKTCSSDSMHVSPQIKRNSTRRRMELMPSDGGSWVDLKDHPEADLVLTPAMKRYVDQGKFGSHPDVYGRLWWDRPAVTIKRECAHMGNGRYSHPEQNRLLTVREMATLQGFPLPYRFVSPSLANMYRHIGDAVPPIISYQLAWLVRWIFSGEKPRIQEVVLPNSHFTAEAIRPCQAPIEQPTFLPGQAT
jgi:DNA (cytosine-5)-methyltransferase 1